MNVDGRFIFVGILLVGLGLYYLKNSQDFTDGGLDLGTPGDRDSLFGGLQQPFKVAGLVLILGGIASFLKAFHIF